MRKALLLPFILLFTLVNTAYSQSTTIINPAGDGGFETGADFAANGWTVLNTGATNQWFVGTVPTLFPTKSAFISNNAGVAHAYTNTAGSMVYFYRDVTFPAGQTDINLSFQWYCTGESTYDFYQVAIGPTSITPAVNANVVGSISPITTALIANTTVLSAGNLQATVQNVSTCINSAVAGNASSSSTMRLFFIWRNDGSAGSLPAAIDNISLVSATPGVPTAQPTGLTLTAISNSQINGSFTAAAGAPTGYLVVRYPAGSTVTPPVNGTNYIAGNALGSGTVVSAGATTTFNATGLSGGTNYDFYVYSYIALTCTGNNYLTTTPLTGTRATNPCGGLSGGTYTVGPTGTYVSLTAALTAVNAGITGPIILELQSTYNSSVETFPIVLPNNACIGPLNTLTIRPATGATNLSINSNNAGATIDLSGAKFVTIDGRPGGTGTISQLSIINNNAGGVAIRFVNDAQNNTIRFCDIQGQNTANTSSLTTLSGVIYFGGADAIGLNGNDNNTITNCFIHSTGGGTASILVSAIGTTTSVGTYNDNNTITNCRIYDFFNAASASTAVKLDAGNNAWTITNNSVYQTTPRVYTTAATHRGFWITPNTASIANTASGFIITGNFIGGSDVNCGGAAANLSGTVATVFFGMDLSTGLGTATSVQGNTIRNITLTTSSSTTAGIFVGISTANGNNDIGTVTGNTIGSSTTAGSIAITTSASGGTSFGIRLGGGNVLNVSNNTISGITVSGGGTISTNFIGIGTGGGTTINVTGNTIGSATLNNSINAAVSNSATAQSVTGINIANGTTTSVQNNLITNINNDYTGTGAGLTRGIVVTTSASLISGNRVENLSSSSPTAGSGSSSAIVGIAMTSTNAAGCNVIGNTIDSLVLTSSNTTAAYKIVGIFYSGATSVTSIIARNHIHSFDLTASNTASIFTGIDYATGTVTLANNMIRLGLKPNGSDITNETTIRGISSNSSTTTNNIYFNSIYIGGQNVGGASSNSFAFIRTATSGTYDIRNNIFVNNRSNGGGGGKHYAVYFTTATTGVSINYNLYQTAGNGGNFGYNGTADVMPYVTGWISGDVNSIVADPRFRTPNGSSSTGDLHISATLPTPIEGAGILIASITDDFDGQTRTGLTPTDIGADAGNFIGVDISGPSISYTALPVKSICITPAVITATITDASLVNTTAGTRPRLWYKKEGNNNALPASNNSAGNGWKWVEASNTTSPFTFTMDYALLTSPVVAGDSISYFIVAQDLATPTPNVGLNTGIFNTSPASVALSAGAFPISGNINGFRILNQPTPITIKSSRTDLCASSPANTVVLDVDGVDVTGGQLQWQSSPNGTTGWTDISGATTVPYTTAAITSNTSYRLVVRCGGTPIASSPSNVVTVAVNNPVVTGTTPASKCGPGTVNLSATTAPGNTLKWYAAATGGTSLFTGSTFTTPSINSTTTYYVAATGAGSTIANVGRTAYSGTDGTNTSGAYLIFDAFQPFTLSTVDIYPYSATNGTSGTVTIQLQSSTGAILQTATVNVTGNNTPVLATVSVNFSVPAGTAMRLVYASSSGVTALYRNTTDTGFPYTLPGILSITNGSLSGYYYYFYNWGVEVSCEGTRTAVTATINTPPAITKQATPATICEGQSATLSTSSTNAGYTYTWTPGNLSGASVSVSPTTTTKYYVNAADNTSGTFAGCVNRDSVIVTVNPRPSVLDITPAAPTLCNTNPAQLLSTTGGTIVGEYTFGTQAAQNTSSTYPAPYSVYFGSQRTQMLITAAELTAQGMQAGSITSISFPVVSLGSNWGGSLTACQDFQMSIGSTSLTSLTAFQTGLTQVIAPANFTPTVGYANTHTFGTPFVWDGTSNLIIEVTFGNNISGTTNDAVIQYNTTTAYQSTIVYRADNVTSAAAATATTISSSFSARVDFKLNSLVPTTITWSPVTGLFTNAAATTAYTGGNSANVYAKPSSTTTYTATASTALNCVRTKTVTVTITCPVPVSLLSFNGDRQGGINKLWWTTASELNNHGFELQRSADGVNFSSLGFVGTKAPNGNSNALLNYEFNDAKPLSGNNYYRLKQIDKDGKNSLSQVVLIKGLKATQLTITSVYPNPVKDVLNMVIGTPVNEQVNIVLMDVAGKVLMSKSTRLLAGDNSQQLDVSKLASGTYAIKLICANGCETATWKFVK